MLWRPSLVGSDDIFKRKRREKRTRKENIRNLAPYRYLIVCEGEQTEPNYFESIKKRLDMKYIDRIRVEQKIQLDIKGTGRNTNSLVEFVELLTSKAAIPYGHIWVIFDKDDFSDGQFNSAIEQAVSNGYRVAWSNEAIELWFLLHFEYLNSRINRDQYCKKLTEHFKKHNIGNGKYSKNNSEIFEILMQYGSVEEAIKRSIKLIELHQECGNYISKAKMKPATTIYELVNELLEYLV